MVEEGSKGSEDGHIGVDMLSTVRKPARPLCPKATHGGGCLLYTGLLLDVVALLGPW